MPLGEGDVGMERFLRTLKELGYTGPLTIEREIPQDPARQKEEIGRGIRLLNELKAKIGVERNSFRSTWRTDEFRSPETGT